VRAAHHCCTCTHSYIMHQPATHVLDELDAAQVQVVGRVGGQQVGRVDAHRLDGGVACQLGAAPQEGQELVVVQAPHAVRARRLQPAASCKFHDPLYPNRFTAQTLTPYWQYMSACCTAVLEQRLACSPRIAPVQPAGCCRAAHALTMPRNCSPVRLLDFAHEVQVEREHAGDERLRVRLPEHPRHAQAVQQRRECRLVPRAVVDAGCVACTVQSVS
jgi:hypothetical protein